MIPHKLLKSFYCRRPNVLKLNSKCLLQSYSKDSSSSSSSSDDEKQMKSIAEKPRAVPKKSEETLKKLNILLQQIVEDDKQPTVTKKLDLAKAKGHLKVKKESATKKLDIVAAAKNVADSFGGDKQIELELLGKLLGAPVTKDTSESVDKKSLSLNEVLVGMKIDRTAKPATEEVSKAHRVRQVSMTDDRRKTKKHDSVSTLLHRSRIIPKSEMEKTDLFGGTPLEIFTIDSFQPIEKQVTLKTWNILMERELQLAVTHPPENYFQEMILWTKQEKIWKFPIDNEQGMEEEQNIAFTEHIFLEKHLEPWCPSKGPIRHFMELVCVGLSKNPYLTVQAKQNHFEWYKNYFASKEPLLKEVGAIPANFADQKQLDS